MFGEVRLKAVPGMIALKSSKVPVQQFKQSLSGGGFRVDDEVGRALSLTLARMVRTAQTVHGLMEGKGAAQGSRGSTTKYTNSKPGGGTGREQSTQNITLNSKID